MLLSFYGWASGKTGRTQQAEALAAALEQRRREGYFSAALIAGCYAGLGDIDRAVSWMQVACDERDGVGMLFAGRVWYADLCSDARFQALLRKMNFPTPPQPK